MSKGKDNKLKIKREVKRIKVYVSADGTAYSEVGKQRCIQNITLQYINNMEMLIKFLEERYTVLELFELDKEEKENIKQEFYEEMKNSAVIAFDNLFEECKVQD